jgi:hypothetical protein
MTFEDWKTEYAHRLKLVAGFKTVEFAREHMPHDDILKEFWETGFTPGEAVDEMDWDE